jgi:hypothetical protein
VGPGRALLGACEAENRFVLELLVTELVRPLPSRNYDGHKQALQPDESDVRCVVVVCLDDLVLPQVSGGIVFAQLDGRVRVSRASSVP